MRKLFRWASARIVAMLALMLPLAAMATAPTATAVWRSNLGQSYTIGGHTYTITPGTDNTVNLDGNLVIGGTTSGGVIALPSGVNKVSVLIKYKNLVGAPSGTPYTALATVKESGNYEPGLYADTDTYPAGLTLVGNFGTSNVYALSPTEPELVAGEGYFMFAYSAPEGTAGYTGSAVSSLTGGRNGNLHWSNNTINSVSIGGGHTTTVGIPWSGLEIEEVALFVGSYLSASDVAEYVFPTVTVDSAVTTMSALNTKVADLGNEFLYFSDAATVTLDEEPSAATTAYLQSANWNGTVLIKDEDKNNINPTLYGNKNSTLKLSGVKGFFYHARNDVNRQYLNTVTPAIELEDSDTEGREYGFYQANGYSFPGASNQFLVNTPELKGSGTLKCDSSGAGSTIKTLLIVDKWDAFTGKLNLSASAVWFGTGLPALDGTDDGLIVTGGVRLGSTIPANYSTWTVSGGYAGTVVQTTAATADEVSFFTASAWKGTCKLNWNATGKLDIVNYGNGNSVIEIPSTFSALPTQNGGTQAANVAAEVKVVGNWTVSDGWTDKTTTFAKLSGAGTLTVNGGSGGVGAAIPYTITRLEGFTGTLAGARGQFTIGTIVAADEPTPGAKLVSCTTSNEPVLDNTEVYYNNAKVDDIELEFKAGDGIYVADPTYVAYTVTVVRDYDDPSDPQSTYTETFTTNYFETINAAIATTPSPDKIYLIDSSIEAPAGWQKSLEDETYVLTPIPPVAYVDGMGSSNGYTDLSEALAAALASGTHSLYIVSSQTLETLTVPDGCTLTLSVPSALGGALDVSNIVVEAGASLQMATAVEAEYDVSGTLALNSGDFTGSSVDLAAVGATCTVRSGVTAPAIATSVADYEVKNDNGTYGIRLDKGWMYEDVNFQNYTGGWSNAVEYVGGKVVIEEANSFTNATPSAAGSTVTITMTLSFDGTNEEEVDLDAKAAVRLGTNGCFQVYTAVDGESPTKTWVDVTASGVTPEADQDYTFEFVLDCTDKTYTVALVDGNTKTPLQGENDQTEFDFANKYALGAADTIQQIDFIGAGTVTSIAGSYAEAQPPADEFNADETIGSVTLSAAQATWLNGQDNYAALSTKLATMTQKALDVAYLLNLDVTSEQYDGTYSFTVTKVEFGEDAMHNETVEVTVSLTRSGAFDGGINGTLKLQGCTVLGAGFTDLDEVAIVDADFSDGVTTKCTFLKGADPAEFYQAVIE